MLKKDMVERQVNRLREALRMADLSLISVTPYSDLDLAEKLIDTRNSDEYAHMYGVKIDDDQFLDVYLKGDRIYSFTTMSKGEDSRRYFIVYCHH